MDRGLTGHIDSRATVKRSGGGQCTLHPARVCVCVCARARVWNTCTWSGPLAADISWGSSPAWLPGPRTHTLSCSTHHHHHHCPKIPQQFFQSWPRLHRCGAFNWRVPEKSSPGGKAAGWGGGKGLRRKMVLIELRHPYLRVIVIPLNLFTLTHGV